MYPLLSLCLLVVQPPVVAAPTTPRNLAEALANVSWSADERGVLLVVGAEQVRATAGLMPPPPRGYNVRELARTFGVMTITQGSLTALVPTTMRVLVKPTQSPEEASWESPDEAFKALLASLSESQWRTASDENGIGLSDLNKEQRDIFLASFPNPLTLQPTGVTKIERTELGSARIRFEQPPAGMVPVTLTPEQRGNVRIRINRTMQLMYAAEGSDGSVLSGSGRGPVSQEAPHYQVRSVFRGVNQQAGVEDLPNRQKPSDLDLSRLHGTVELTNATTLGELVKRAAQASGQELYADPRVAGLPVQVWGQRASVGELLAVLCRSVTGTFRRVGDAYVLTHDRVGLASLSEPIVQWQAAVARLQEARHQAQRKALQKTSITHLIGFSPTDPLRLTSELLEKVDAQPATGRSVGLRVSELPPAAQLAVKDQITTMQEDIAAGRMSVNHNGKSVTAFRSDMVWPRFELTRTLIVPGLGGVHWDQNSALFQLRNAIFERRSEAQPTPKRAAQPVLTWSAGERVAVVTARTPDDANALARAAKLCGLNQLWLAVPLNVERAKALVSAAQREGIAVGLAVSAFDVPAAAPPPGVTPDLSATGLTSDLYAQRSLSVSSSETELPNTESTKRIVRGDDAVLLALSDLARIPKLASLYFTDLVPPGYQNPDSREHIMFTQPRPGDFGYTLDNRLAFLRQTGCDPIDSIPPKNYISSSGLPFFPPFNMISRPRFIRPQESPRSMQPQVDNVYQQWQAFRAAQNTAFLPRIRTRLQQTAPNLPVFAADDGSFIWAGSWDTPEKRPTLSAGLQNYDFSNKAVLPQVRKVSQRVFNSIPSYLSTKVENLIDDINANTQNYPNWDGTLLSFRDLPVAQVLSLLNGLAESK